jgi:hypothetical protein
MAVRFVNIDYDTPVDPAPNLRDWVPAGHLAHFTRERSSWKERPKRKL